MDKRTRARELAVQALYQLDIQGSEILNPLYNFFLENETDHEIREMAMNWTYHTWENLQDCDSLIKQSIIKWQPERLSRVDRAILRLGAYQLKFCPHIPKKVVINEAINIAKKFSTDNSSMFVNGVLDAVLRKLQKKEKPESF